MDRVLYEMTSRQERQAAVRLAVVSLGFPIILSEVAMYVMICAFLIKHDKMMMLVLDALVIRGRIRKNVIDLFGHIVNFVIELLLLVFAAVGSYWMPTNMKFVSRCLSMSSYGILGAFHICFSPVLRREFCRVFGQLRRLGPIFKWAKKTEIQAKQSLH